ncbi:hypothetical protein FKW77_005978 [Venturia effusa]|uniref:Uncharacterized protein n=1 Tax=Venturia effusa TaxID=50376 RepID=A0A517LIW2_9PEZI|nr:hypothetical protein FKW77_005978 [Venturia effusa]
MFKKVQHHASKIGIRFRTKAEKCQKWLTDPEHEHRGTACLPAIRYSRKLWQLIRPRAKKHQQEVADDTTIKRSPSLMTLPRELRQQILLDTYDLNNHRNLKPLHYNRFHDFMCLRAQHVEAWSLNLRKVHPEMDRDMDFVTKTWAAQLHKIQGQLTYEFNYVWKNVLFENHAGMTPRQIAWRQQYREMFAEMGFLAHKVYWEANHPVLKYVRKIPGLRRRLGVDTRERMVWKHLHGYLQVAWDIVNDVPDDEDSWSDSSNF